jgi:hypothetical protein
MSHSEVALTDKDFALEPKNLAERIRAEHQAVITAATDMVRHAIEAGRLLIEAKAQVNHGGWLPWLEEHCELSERQAQRYMRLAERMPKLLEANPSRVSDLSTLSIRGALAMLATPREEEPEPVTLPFELDFGRAIEGVMDHYMSTHWLIWIHPSEREDEDEPGVGYFFVNVESSDRIDGGGTLDGLKKPIRQDGVAMVLDRFCPAWRQVAEWKSFRVAPWKYNELLYSSYENYIDEAVLGHDYRCRCVRDGTASHPKAPTNAVSRRAM